jgi:hypothetical protein
MLAKDPADRFQSPAEVAEALRPFTPGADLGRLLAAGGAAAGGPCAAAPTPTPGLWDTASEPGGRGRRFPAAPSRYALPVALAAGLGLLLAAWFLWPGTRDPSGPAVRPLEITGMHVTQFRGKGATLLGDLWTAPGAVRLNDDVRVAAELSAPAYCYLIAFNPDGSEQLCYPDDADGQAAPAARPEARPEFRYPQDRHVFVLDAVGLQAFVLAASAKPLPPYAQWRSRAGAAPWEAVRVGGAWRWHFDGREFVRYPRERGKIEPKQAAPEPLRKLCDFFRSRPEFDTVQLVAFPVVGKP